MKTTRFTDEQIIAFFKQLTTRLVERALEAEMSVNLGHDKNKPVANSRV